MNFTFFSMLPQKKTNVKLKATCTVDIDGDRTSILETMSLDPPSVSVSVKYWTSNQFLINLVQGR